MAGRLKSSNTSSSSKFENEASKLRNENKWTRLQEFASSTSTKDKKSEVLIKFYYAEANLENYLFSNPIIFSSTLTINENGNANDGSSSSSASFSSKSSKNNLYETELTFKDIITKVDSLQISIEASMLLAKLFYSQMRFQEANNVLNSNKLQMILSDHISKLKKNQQPPATDSPRQLQLFAECHSIKGLCLELESRRIADGQHKIIDDQEIIDSYEMSSLFAIQHSIIMHQQFSSSQSLAQQAQGIGTLPSANTANLNPSSSSSLDSNQALMSLNILNNNDDNLDLINPFYEISLQKAPLLYIKKGDFQMGIKKFRESLLKKNIQSITSIRQVLLKKYSECLLFSIPLKEYYTLKLSNEDNRLKLYKPLNRDEEILLSLTLSQYLASTEVMIFRQPQFKQMRELTFKNAISSLDLLIFYLCYHRSFNIIAEKFEMTMKYSFEKFYVWYQYGLSLMADQKFHRAYLVFKECSRMDQKHVTVHLLLARLALENLYAIDEAIQWSNKVLEVTESKNIKANILLGCALCIKAKLQKQHSVQKGFYDQALEAFLKASMLDPSDYLPLYHIAHCYSIRRQINESIEYVYKALKLKPDDKDSMHLLALLLSSIKNYEEAHNMISKACDLYDDFELLYTKIRIEEVLFGYNVSQGSVLNLILIYKQKLQSPSHQNELNGNNTAPTSAIQSNYITYGGSVNKMPGAAPQLNQSSENWSTFENASLLNLQYTYKLNESIGKTITMLVQSDQLAFKYGNSYAQSNNIQQTLLLVRILTQIGEFYLRHDKLSDAEMCCQEISYIHPMSYLHIYLKGRIFEYKQEYAQAKLCYQNALSLNPHHIQSLQQIAIVLCELQNFHLAEKMIRDAISINSALPDSWHILARVLDYQNDSQSAIKCYQTCLQLEATNPILPFSSLTRTL